MKKLLIGIALLVLLAGLGALAWRCFVTNRVTDIGGMENPDSSRSETGY